MYVHHRQRQGARDWNRMMDPVPSCPDSDRSAEAPSNPSDKDVARMAQAGGVDLIHFLLAKAVSPTDTAEILPSPNSVREWQFRDILKFPKEIQEEWKAACHEELEALRRQNVFEVTNLPKSRKKLRTVGSLTSNLMVVKRLDLLPKVSLKWKA